MSGVPFVEGDWSFDLQYRLGRRSANNPQTGPGGLVLQNLTHQNYNLATDIRVVGVWVGSIDLTGPPQLFELGAPEMQLVESQEIALPDQLGLIAPFRAPYRLRATYRTPGPVLGDGSKPLTIRQDYLFTDYGKDPPHEPGALIDAARLYPLVSFSYPGDPSDKIRVDMIRVDLRMAFSLDRLGAGYLVPELNDDNQAGVFHDTDRLHSGTSINTVFVAAEKPLPWELLGAGISADDRPTWDNIHQWPVARKLPATPGAAHCMHLHWRWGAFSTVSRFPHSAGGSQFQGTFRGVQEKANPPLLDPRILDQTLEFAITKWQEHDIDSPSTWAPDSAPTTANFEDLFRRARPVPADISKGAKLVTWLSATALRLPADGGKWEGTFFAHGLFFSHQHEPFKLKFGKLLGIGSDLNDPLLKNSKGRQEWRRP